jgi:hypothetical protein
MGLVGALARLLGILALALLVAAGWLYRDRLVSGFPWWRRGPAAGVAPAGVGHPGAEALRRARDKIDSLNGWRADSILLTPSEMASLVGDGLDPDIRKYLDSLEVELGPDDLGLSASLETRRIPRDALGPVAGLLADRERVGAHGTVRVLGPGKAEWTVRRLSMRGIPLPDDLRRRVVEKALGGSGEILEFRIPPGIAGVAIRPGRAVVYRKEMAE